RLALLVDAHEPARQSRLAAEYPPRFVAEALARAVEHARVPDRTDHASQAEAPAKFAGTARILDEAIALHSQRILGLDRLDGEIGGVGRVDLHTILAVVVVASAEAAAERFQIEIMMPGARIAPGEYRD